MRIVFDKMEAHERDMVEAALSGHTLTFLDTPLTKDDVIPTDTDVLSVFVSSSVTRAHMEQAPQLKMIATRSMGYDHVDSIAAKERGVALSNVPAYGTHTVEEFAFALLLALSRKVYPAYLRLRDESRVDPISSEGFDLYGKTFGVVGTGKIGKNTARLGAAFGMQVILYDVVTDEAFAKEIAAPYESLESLVSKSDIISIHVPLLPTTTHLFNRDLFAKTKRGAYLINTSRGGVVDTVALLEALTRGHLRGAGLDVFEGEKELFGADAGAADLTAAAAAAHSLLAMPNVVMTPHIAYDTTEAKREIVKTALENITSFIGGTPKNTVTL